MVRIPLREGRTLHHDVKGRFGAGKVVVRAAPPGTGIIAGGPMRAIFETMGMQDVVAKSMGTANPHNMMKATFDALGTLPVAARGGGQARQEGCRNRATPRRAGGVRRGMNHGRGHEKIMALKVTQIGSPIGRRKDQRATLVGLGLNKMHRTRELEDTPSCAA